MMNKPDYWAPIPHLMTRHADESTNEATRAYIAHIDARNGFLVINSEALRKAGAIDRVYAEMRAQNYRGDALTIIDRGEKVFIIPSDYEVGICSVGPIPRYEPSLEDTP